MLQIDSDFSRQYPVIRLQGRFDADGADIFEKLTASWIQKSAYWIIDLSQVDIISSNALHSLLKFYNRLDRNGGFFVLTGLQKKPREVLQISGLSQCMLVVDSLDEAQSIIQKTILDNETGLEYLTANGVYHTIKVSKGSSDLFYWMGGDEANNSDRLLPFEVSQVDAALGIGGLGCNRKEGMRKAGLMMTYGHFAGVNAASGQVSSDIVIVTPDAAVNCFMQWAVGIKGNPALKIKLCQGKSLKISEFLSDISYILYRKSITANLPAAALILGEIVDLKAEYYTSLKNLQNGATGKFTPSGDIRGLIAFSIILNESNLSLLPPGIVQNFKKMAVTNTNYIFSYGMTFSDTELLLEADALKDRQQIGIYLDHLQDVVMVRPDTVLRNPQALLYLPSDLISGSELIPNLRTESPEKLNCEWETIARRIFAPAKEITLRRIKEDEGINLFLVDRSGKIYSRSDISPEPQSLAKIEPVKPPALLKIAAKEYIKEEERAYRNYVEKLIPQYNLKIISSAYQGGYGGLHFQFSPKAAADIQLENLHQVFLRQPVEYTLQALRRLFTENFKSWYDQSKMKNLRLYWEHHPLRTNKNLLELAESELKISPEANSLACPELGGSIPNPYNFLKYEYPRRILQYDRWFTAVCPGNMNLRKILVDPAGNIYYTDFRELKPRNIVTDFARLEASLIMESAVFNQDEHSQLALFTAELLKTSSMEDIPKFAYTGTNPQVEKIHKIICKLRQYADKVTIFETDIEPYYIVLLEYMLNASIRPDLTSPQKRLALIAAGLCVQRLIELE